MATNIPAGRKLFRVYVDEVGDRGTKPTSSPFFCFAALMIEDGSPDAHMMATHDIMCQTLSKPVGTNLHWRDNIKPHTQRLYVTSQLGTLPAKATFVAIEKAGCRSGTYILTNPEALYLWSARLLLERISWYVDDAGGVAIVTMGMVKGFKATTLAQYLNKLRGQPTQIRWGALQKVQMRAANSMKGVQCADILAGALDAAIRPQYGFTEPAYLANIAPIIYRRGSGQVESYGLKGIPNGMWSKHTWWPALKAIVP